MLTRRTQNCSLTRGTDRTNRQTDGRTDSRLLLAVDVSRSTSNLQELSQEDRECCCSPCLRQLQGIASGQRVMTKDRIIGTDVFFMEEFNATLDCVSG